MQASTSKAAAQLDADIRAWQQFVGLLQAEQAALIANDGDRIAGLADEKSHLAQRLTAVARNAPVALIALARSARDLNSANAALLQQRIAQTQQALALLRPSGGVSSSVYGPDGRTDKQSSGRGFAVA